MDTAYIGQLLVSISIFAPGIILLAVFGFIGAAVMLEKAGVLGAKKGELATSGTNPEAADVVANLNDAVESGSKEEKRTGTKG